MGLGHPVLDSPGKGACFHLQSEPFFECLAVFYQTTFIHSNPIARCFGGGRRLAFLSALFLGQLKEHRFQCTFTSPLDCGLGKNVNLFQKVLIGLVFSR
jgi:hypothetical protein